jgi:radical SAM protein with 4Fe4S-binding SPASM domain
LKSSALDMPLIYKLLSDAKNLGLLSLTITGGEPFLYKDLFQLLNNIVSLDLVVRAIETNGTLLTTEVVKELSKYKDIISFIAVSLDGPRNVHESTRGYRTFPKVIKSIKMLIDSGFNVSINTIISKDLISLSYKELKIFLDFLVRLGVKGVNFINLHLPIYAPMDIINLKPSYEELMRFSIFMDRLYIEFQDKLLLNIGLPPAMLPKVLRKKVIALNTNCDRPCAHANRSIYIRADGSVVPCPLWDDVLGVFGNIKNSSIKRIWHSILRFMTEIKSFIDSKCNNCALFQKRLCGYWNICIVRGCYYGR